jgi:hypothetical protein
MSRRIDPASVVECLRGRFYGSSVETVKENVPIRNSAALVQKFWNHCNILREDGLS